MELKEALEQVWLTDKLERRADAEFIATFLTNRSDELRDRGASKSYVLNLDAGWGRGKSFFLERLKRQLELAGHLAVYVDAWRDDFADDPLVAAMAAIDAEVLLHVQPEGLAKKSWNVAKTSGLQVVGHMAKGLAMRALSLAITSGGVAAVEATIAAADNVPTGQTEGALSVAEDAGDIAAAAVAKVADAQTTEAISEFVKTQKSIASFRDNLSKFIAALEEKEGRRAPLFVLIDELDRCRPLYAIAMLERIKHLFETPGVVFIVATDSSQLVHSIRAVYGQGFAADRYLKRFFDQTYVFEEPKVEPLVAYLIEKTPLDTSKLNALPEVVPEAFIADFFQHMAPDLRAIEQNYATLSNIVTTWNEPAKIELAVMLPLIHFFYSDRSAFLEEPGAIFSREIKDWEKSVWIRDRGFEATEHKIPIQSIMNRLWLAGQQALQQFINKDASGYPHIWVRDVLIAEQQARSRQPTSELNRDTISLMAGYPSIIKRAGRMA